MLKIAASNYSNSAPLIWSFWHGAQRNSVKYLPDAAPSKCAEMLRAGNVDAALTPVIEFQRIAETAIIPNVCVAAKTAVKSVILVTKGEDLNAAKSVALDVSSRTSAALTEIIFREFYRQTPRFVLHAPDIDKMLAENDAALLIGDPALRVDKSRYRVFDTVEIWREFTNFGFVFAFWLARNTAEIKTSNFVAARDEGLSKIGEIIEFYQDKVTLSPIEFERYLTENIVYSLDDELIAGLNLYFDLAAKHGLIQNRRKLEFL